MKPEISVILPVYRVERYIEQCLGSVLSQSFRDFELLLVDDCSPDGSMDIARRMCAACTDIDVIYLRTPHNAGLSVARNMGIDAACGRYIFFIDSDDYLTPDALEQLMAVARRHPEAEIVYGSARTFGLSDYIGFLDLSTKGLPECIGDTATARRLMLRDFYLPIAAWNRLFRRDWLKRHALRFCPGILAQDLHLNFYMARHVSAIAFCTTPTYHYRLHAGGVTVSRRARQQQCVDWTVCDWLRHLSATGLMAQLRLILHRAHLSYLNRLPEGSPVPAAPRRIAGTIRHLVRLLRRYGPEPPADIDNNVQPKHT